MPSFHSRNRHSSREDTHTVSGNHKPRMRPAPPDATKHGERKEVAAAACEKNDSQYHKDNCDSSHNRKAAYKCDGFHNIEQSLNRSEKELRLNLAIARAGFCSRRKADEYILAGKVRINGKCVTQPGMRVTASDVLEVAGQVITKAPPLAYVLLHKPVQIVCTLHDPQGRKTIVDLLPPELRRIRLFPVGRLDFFSEGLLLLTNDGDLAQRLTHPRHHQPRLYEVLIRGIVTESSLAQMRSGMELGENIRTLPIKVAAKALPAGNTLLTLELRQGLNRQIRRMCAALGLTILRLRRISQGCLQLGKLPAGKTRILDSGEIHALRREAGLE